MLGNTLFRYFSSMDQYETFGTVRSLGPVADLPNSDWLITGVDVESTDSLVRVLTQCRPQIVINCVGVIKQVDSSKDPIMALTINSILPHKLAQLSLLVGARLVHVSTDCVFSGMTGMYKESDTPK